MHREIIHCTCSDNVEKPNTGFPDKTTPVWMKLLQLGVGTQSYFHIMHAHSHTERKTWSVHKHLERQRWCQKSSSGIVRLLQRRKHQVQPKLFCISQVCNNIYDHPLNYFDLCSNSGNPKRSTEDKNWLHPVSKELTQFWFTAFEWWSFHSWVWQGSESPLRFTAGLITIAKAAGGSVEGLVGSLQPLKHRVWMS